MSVQFTPQHAYPHKFAPVPDWFHLNHAGPGYMYPPPAHGVAPAPALPTVSLTLAAADQDEVVVGQRALILHDPAARARQRSPSP